MPKSTLTTDENMKLPSPLHAELKTSMELSLFQAKCAYKTVDFKHNLLTDPLIKIQYQGTVSGQPPLKQLSIDVQYNNIVLCFLETIPLKGPNHLNLK